MNEVEIIMTTYNGEKYIYDQLNSLLNQKNIFFNVSIYDDGSNDQTTSIIQEFIKKNNLDNWNLTINDSNKGWKKNFIDGVKFSNAKYLLFCDQDDIWYDDHISELVSIMKNNKSIKLLCSNYEIIDSEGNLKEQKKYFKNDSSITKINLNQRNFNVLRPGCSYCIDGEFSREKVNKWYDTLPHDKFFWIVSLFNQSLFLYNKILMGYRRHDANNSGLISSKKEMLNKLENECELLEYLSDKNIQKHLFPDIDIDFVINKLKDFNTTKEVLYKKNDIKKFITLFSKYNDCYISWKHMIMEIRYFLLLK